MIIFLLIIGIIVTYVVIGFGWLLLADWSEDYKDESISHEDFWVCIGLWPFVMWFILWWLVKKMLGGYDPSEYYNRWRKTKRKKVVKK
jgi:hypothetical protein